MSADHGRTRNERVRTLGDPIADERLVRLMIDVSDTADTEAVAEAVLDRRDHLGVRVFAWAFGEADEHVRDHLGDCLYDDDGTLWATVAALLPSLLDDQDPRVRDGARLLRDHMTAEERHHRR